MLTCRTALHLNRLGSAAHPSAAAPSPAIVAGLLRRTVARMFHNHEKMPSKEQALPGRDAPVLTGSPKHVLFGTPILPPFPEGMKSIVFGNGCFWGPEMRFWEVPGVYATAVGYIGGLTPNPTYEEVCSGLTGHNEVTRVVYDPSEVSFTDLLKLHWESHDPTQGMGQGNDRGHNYRSGIYCNDEDEIAIATASQAAYQKALDESGAVNGRQITTEIIPSPEFYYAEDYHQQYLARPGARQYCSAQPTMVDLPPFADWAPADTPEELEPKLDAQWWAENPPGCHLFTAAYAQRYKIRRLNAEAKGKL